MRIGFISHIDWNLYLFRSPIIKVLLEAGHTVYVICPKGDYNQRLSDMGCSVVNYEISRKGLNPFFEMKAINNIYEVLKDLNLDLVHTFTVKPNIYGTFAAKRAKVPVIINLVEGMGSFYIESSFKNKIVKTVIESLYKRAFKISNACIFVNGDDADYMQKRSLISKDKIRVIKSVGIDTSYFDITKVSQEALQNLKDELNIDKQVVVLMVARAIWHKGIREYYEAAERICVNNDNIVFLLVGDTDDGNASCADEAYLKSPYVRWLKHRDDILELTALADIYVLPSYREGVPRTLLEAASMSKPIVTTDAIGCREVVKNEYNGFLVPVKNSEMLESKIMTLVKDTPLRSVMGKRGRQLVQENFELQDVVRKYLQTYKEFLDLGDVDV